METKSYYIEGISLIKHSFHCNSIFVSKMYILYLYIYFNLVTYKDYNQSL